MELNLPEKLIFLAHHPVRARFVTSDFQLNYGLIGAVLLELSHEGKIDIRRDHLIVEDTQEISHPVLAEVVHKIRTSGKKKNIKYWVTKLGRSAGPQKKLLLEILSEKGLVKTERRKALWLFPYTVSLVADRNAHQKLRQDILRNALHPKDLTVEDTVMLGLIQGCKLHHALTTERSELRQIKRSLKSFLKDDPIAASVDKTVKEVQMAVMVAIMAATTSTMATTTTVSSS